MKTASFEVVSDDRWRRHALCGLFTALWFIVMSGSILRLISYSLDFNNSAASHIVVVPFISTVLIYANRKKIFQDVAYSPVLAFLAFAIGGSLFVAGKRLDTGLDNPDQLALFISAVVVVWLGAFVFFYGQTAFRAALFTLLFLFLCVPIPSVILDRIIAFLQVRSADMAYVILKLTGTPIHRQGTIFILPDLIIGVEPECSGIRSGISLFISSLVAGYVFLQSFWRRTALLVVAIPVLIFKNALRIAVLTYLAIYIDKRILTSALHREGGIPFFVLGLVFLTPVLTLLVKSERLRQKRLATSLGSIQSMPVRPGASDDC